MSFPLTSILDNFNRSDGDPGANWSGPAVGDVNKLTIKSNQVTTAGGGVGTQFGAEYWNQSTLGPNCEAYVTVQTIPTSTSAIAVYARIDTPGSGSFHGYSFQNTSTASGLGISWELIRWDGATHTVLASGNNVLTTGQSIGISCVGSAITGWIKNSGGSWTSFASVIDSNYGSAGYVVLETPDTVCRVDDFGGGTLGSKSQTSTAKIQIVGTKLQTAKARIQSLVTKAQTAKARIQKSTTKTQTATARIQIGGSKTQTSIARIVSSTVDLNLPFISSKTRVWNIFSLYNPDNVYSGPGNGGETFEVQLNLNGVTTTATLAAGIGISGSPSLTMSGDSGMPDAGVEFVVTIDSEQILLISRGASSYMVRQRGMGNTTPAAHSSGATVSWGDSYDEPITSTIFINSAFTADIESTGSTVYNGWLVAFDSSQAYKSDGSRYPLHVSELVGVFVLGAGTSGTNKLDGSQPSAIHAPEAPSDHCGAALTVPALIAIDIVPGDVVVVRYKNPEAYTLDLGPRSGAIQSWYGLKRVDLTDNDVTFTNPNGIVVDTKSGYATYTGSVNTEPNEPLPSVIGIAPDSSDAAGTPIPTPNPVPWLNVTLPGTDRYFTDSIHYNERGWPIGVLSCRQGGRRVPLWQSWDWHEFSYVYSGFGTDDSFAQVVINRNGMTGLLPTISLPGPQDIDGPDAVWDDGTYYFGASWYVVLVATPYLVVGPVIGGTSGPTGPVGPTIPTVTFPGGGTPPVISPPVIDGGSGGDIAPTSTGLHTWQIF